MPHVSSVLVDLAGRTTPELARRHLFELRDRVGPEPPIDATWLGELPSELPPNVHLVTHGAGGRALAAAAGHASCPGGHLVVLLGTVLPDSAVIQGLLSAFDLDPLVGFAQPRFSDATGEGIWSLPGCAGAEPVLHPRRMLSVLPAHYLTTERLSACLVIRREVAAGFAASPDGTDGLPASLLGELCLARRRGFRNLVLNGVVVPSDEPAAALYPALDPRAREALEERFPDALTAEEWFTGAAHQRFERVAAKVRRERPGKPLSVLLDCRGAQALHNGTSQAILGLLDGLGAAAPRWDVELLFSEDAAGYHRVARRYPTLRVVTALPERAYAAAVRLDQPWDLSTVAELHRRACAVAFNVLDTIAWDVVYLGSPELGKVWRVIAEHADGLLYNSGFTRARFGFRFQVAPDVIETVTHHSVDPAEHRAPSTERLAPEDHLLVFGNHYEHKAVASTLDLLCRAFPYQPIRALGPELAPRAHVTSSPSGRLPAAEIDRLIATARVVVFPSYYEGFGLPVVKALAYGRTVVVRASPLWRELAGCSRSPGRLVEFVTPHELVAAVGKALADEPQNGLPQGTDLRGDPPRWGDCAQALVEHVERIASGSSFRRWGARDHALALAGV
jgi:glycosyltransferase involved in cell wall biosynthesis